MFSRTHQTYFACQFICILLLQQQYNRKTCNQHKYFDSFFKSKHTYTLIYMSFGNANETYSFVAFFSFRVPHAIVYCVFSCFAFASICVVFSHFTDLNMENIFIIHSVYRRQIVLYCYWFAVMNALVFAGGFSFRLVLVSFFLIFCFRLRFCVSSTISKHKYSVCIFFCYLLRILRLVWCGSAVVYFAAGEKKVNEREIERDDYRTNASEMYSTKVIRRAVALHRTPNEIH